MKTQKILFSNLAIFAVTMGFLLGAVFSLPAGAALIDRGNGLIYDDVLDITWLQDASLGGNRTPGSAAAWADELVFGGFDDWRLPSAKVDGRTGLPVNCESASEADCRSNELGYMYWHNLGGTGNDLTGDQGLIQNIQPIHWSGTEWQANPGNFWITSFVNGNRSVGRQFDEFGAWAVRSDNALQEPTEVIFSENITSTRQAIAIKNLNVSGTIYNVAFSANETTAKMVYGDYPGTFDFKTPEAAARAMDAANAALTGVAAETVGAEEQLGAIWYRIGFGSTEVWPSIPTVIFWETLTDEEGPDPWIRNPAEDVDHYNLGVRVWAKFTPVSGGPEPVSIGGSVTGLTGSGLVLQNNGADDEPIAADGTFTFDTLLPPSSSYSVTVKTQPSGQNCTVAKGSGTVPAGGVDDVLVTCGDLPDLDEIIATWNNGMWYWDFATGKWTQLSTDFTKGDIAAADFTADGTADVAAVFDFGPASNQSGPGIYYLDGDSKKWTLIPNSAPPAFHITAGDVTGDGRPEVIGTWSVGIWYYDFATADWTELTTDTTSDDIAAADFTGDGIADVAAIFQVGPASNPQGAGLYYLDGVSKAWTLVPNSEPAPFSVTAGDVTGDARPEIIATWSVGIWYWDVVAADWDLLTDVATNNGIAAGNFVRNGIADVAAVFELAPATDPLAGDGLFYYLTDVSVGFTKLPDSSPAPFNVAVGDVAPE